MFEPSSTRATSRRRVTAPSLPVFSTMAPNSSGVSRRPRAFTSSCVVAPVGCGEAPMAPADTWMFCSWMAPMMSSAVRPRFAAWSGSIQTRIA